MIYFILAFIVAASLALLILPNKHAAGTRTALLLSAFVALASFGLYAILGKPDMPQQIAAWHESRLQLAKKISALSQEVQKHPENAVLWAKLGQAFMEGEQYASAVHAYKQAVLLSGGNASLILEMAKAQILAAGELTPEAENALHMVLSLEPENADAKRLLAAKRQ